jgi:hypothetical protein
MVLIARRGDDRGVLVAQTSTLVMYYWQNEGEERGSSRSITAAATACIVDTVHSRTRRHRRPAR